MSVKTVAQVGVGQSSEIIFFGGNPFNIGFGAVVSGTATYTIQHRFDASNWFDNEFVVGSIANDDGNIAFPIAAMRINITAGTGTVTLTAIQARGI